MVPEQEPFLDLGRARHPRGPGFRIRLSPAERVRAARRFPQAVVKVTSYSSGKAQVAHHLRYISRNGKLELETDRGLVLTTPQDQKDLVEDWVNDFDERPRSRDAVNIVFSMPPGSSADALRKSVRTVLGRSFTNHETVFAVHEDRMHPHAHAVVKMRGRETKKKLRLNKPELYRLREMFAQAAREQGVWLAASPRAARGVGKKGDRQAVYHLRQKGVIPKVDKEAANEAALDLRKGAVQEKPWERAMSKRHQLEKEACFLEARALRQAAMQKEGEERKKLWNAAKDIEQFGRTLPKPKTRRQALIERATPSTDRSKSKNLPHGPELER